ncbi:hypothetical protein Anapl_09204 [Anas platyrhynchos]|uniref:Uncharacterized protein n=1 Tax=Anas platyrhynchos TaxID=8839 RepID=R0JKD2_ANAPL|nr:hypothetical protein Anapl_09204 [Anas platyrhynchos]
MVPATTMEKSQKLTRFSAHLNPLLNKQVPHLRLRGFEEDAERYHLLYVDRRLQHVPSCLMQAFITAFSSVTTPLSFTQDQKDVTATQLLLDRWGHLSKMRQEVKSTSCCGTPVKKNLDNSTQVCKELYSVVFILAMEASTIYTKSLMAGNKKTVSSDKRSAGNNSWLQLANPKIWVQQQLNCSYILQNETAGTQHKGNDHPESPGNSVFIAAAATGATHVTQPTSSSTGPLLVFIGRGEDESSEAVHSVGERIKAFTNRGSKVREQLNYCICCYWKQNCARGTMNNNCGTKNMWVVNQSLTRKYRIFTKQELLRLRASPVTCGTAHAESLSSTTGPHLLQVDLAGLQYKATGSCRTHVYLSKHCGAPLSRGKQENWLVLLKNCNLESPTVFSERPWAVLGPREQDKPQLLEKNWAPRGFESRLTCRTHQNGVGWKAEMQVIAAVAEGKPARDKERSSKSAYLWGLIKTQLRCCIVSLPVTPGCSTQLFEQENKIKLPVLPRQKGVKNHPGCQAATGDHKEDLQVRGSTQHVCIQRKSTRAELRREAADTRLWQPYLKWKLLEAAPTQHQHHPLTKQPLQQSLKEIP